MDSYDEAGSDDEVGSDTDDDSDTGSEDEIYKVSSRTRRTKRYVGNRNRIHFMQNGANASDKNPIF